MSEPSNASELEKRLREIIATHKGDLLSGLIRAARIGAEIERSAITEWLQNDGAGTGCASKSWATYFATCIQVGAHECIAHGEICETDGCEYDASRARGGK